MIVRAPVSDAVTLGLKLTVKVHVAPAPRLEDGQSFVCEKSAAFGPVTAILEMFIGAVPVFPKMIDCAGTATPTPLF